MTTWTADIDAAYAALRPAQWKGYWPCGADWLSRADFRGEHVTWQRDEAGNQWARQDDHDDEPFYSTRTGPDTGTADGFPHAPLRAVLGAATATVTRTQLTGQRGGAVPEAYVRKSTRYDCQALQSCPALV
ncbi:hypothetical protein [Nonomuraea wenchangensis]|uniref:hypothetical protein n=1 Tax=Nonomuraea wenchangensis TaxID=568860 RepID=UPI0037A82FC7